VKGRRKSGFMFSSYLDVRLQVCRRVIDEELAQHVVKGGAALLISLGAN